MHLGIHSLLKYLLIRFLDVSLWPARLRRPKPKRSVLNLSDLAVENRFVQLFEVEDLHVLLTKRRTVYRSVLGAILSYSLKVRFIVSIRQVSSLSLCSIVVATPIILKVVLSNRAGKCFDIFAYCYSSSSIFLFQITSLYPFSLSFDC